MAQLEVEAAKAILTRVEAGRWFSAAGQAEARRKCGEALQAYLLRCGIKRPDIRWASGWDEAGPIVRGLDHGAAVWQPEETERLRALKAVRAAGRGAVLKEALNRLSEIGYEQVRPEIDDEELARVASGAGLWSASAALTWAVAEDLLAPDKSPFSPKLRIFELGHWPLGFCQDAFVIL